MNRSRLFIVSLFLLIAVSAQASWYDDYDKGLIAVRKGQWSTVVQAMSAAIKGNPKESNKAKTYGTIFINYHPYYYRGVAYMNLGKYEQAIADLETTSGPGPENLGSIEMLMDSAKTKLAASASTPDPEPAKPTPEPIKPAPVTPALPTIDPALRQRASGALNATKQKLQAAQQRKATGSPQYTQAMSLYTDATSKNAAARNNDDLNAVITIAENAGDLAELATAPAVATPTPAPVTPTPSVTKPTAAASLVLADTQQQVRRALENYFAGEFELASRQFEQLTGSMPNNGWIWAFLGASQYSQYAFEADESYKLKALRSFRKAKQYRQWKGGLPTQYFSRRIRRAFNEVG